WASNTPLTGKIPDFIGNWTDLRTLRFQGNSFEGPIPSSFSKLTSLTSLRITDLANVSLNLDFIKDMKSLTDLILRSALISDSIPSNIGEYNSLQILDLSFNNLTGQIPSALFNMSSLTYLFLGNNSLSGNLPSQKSNSLQNIIMCQLIRESFPAEIYHTIIFQGLFRLGNLVANDFTFDSSNISVFPGLNCLQRDFPCNRDIPLCELLLHLHIWHHIFVDYIIGHRSRNRDSNKCNSKRRHSQNRFADANFSVNCGGPQMTSDAGTVFEADNLTTLGVASVNVTNTEKWAVSNVGLFLDKMNPTYLERTLTQVTGTNTPELFQTSRLSAGSLRYYGLGLQNGSYTVSLQFAETVFADRSTQTWESLGRRVFNIYIQGHLREKDFDISKEAGGVNRAILKPFSVNVTQNYLEIHLFWGGKGTCCAPNQGDYGPLISALSVVSDFEPNVSGIPPGTSTSDNSKTGIIVGVLVAAVVVCLMLIFAIFYFRRKSYADEEELLGLSAKPNTFSYAELRSATNDFNPANKLGEGGFGPVYKGILSDGNVVAVKQLSVASHQGKNQFVTEIATISAVQHRNLVKLYGCCIDGNKRLLVYEYLENKSLDQALFGAKDLHLDWKTRFSILLGTARGLAYLHEDSRPRIVHRDVKASNILLDAELCPKISDFGLAKLYDDKKTHISTRVAGTIGYLAPEYAMRGHLTEKADVFGYGVVALEILSGRPNSDDRLDGEQRYLLEWAWNLYENKRILELVDPTVTAFDEGEALRITGVAFLCTQSSPNLRPPMSRVVAMLTGDIDVNAVTSKPSYLTDWNFKDITSSFLDDDDPESKLAKAGDSEKDSSSTRFTTNPNPSPINLTEPILPDIIGEG
ncbi:Protein kinase domain, partial [Dillenia turbinata]